MSGKRHLFVAVMRTAFGEVLQARRLADALVADGDHVSFVAPAEVQAALAGGPFRRGVIESLGAPLLDELLPQLAASERCDSVCLVDLAAVVLVFGQLGLPLASLREIPARVVALDLWSLAETDRVFDFGAIRQVIPEDALAIPQLVPVPFARPEARGGYNAWPSNRALAPADRAEVRRRHGLAADERVLVLATAAWQAPERALDDAMRASAQAVPPILLARAARAGATVVHVGPAAWQTPGPRYRHLPQLPPSEFQAVVAAADALVTANLSATTIATALAAEVPVIAVTCDGPTIPPFRVWPLGMTHLLGQLLADNPLLSCVRVVDLFDEDAFVAALPPDPGWPAQLAEYRARVAALPGPAARYRALLAG